MKKLKAMIRWSYYLQKTSLFVLSVLLSTISFSQTWNQKGIDIDGEAADDLLGSYFSVSMPDANTVAIGAPWNDGNGTDAGQVRIYEWDGSVWVQKGQDIVGEAAYDLLGLSVSMPDANTVAIGAPWNDGNGTDAGHVRVYEWNGTAWQQKGGDIDGEAADDWSGASISMPDANTVAIAAPRNDGNGTFSGQVRIYEWDGSVWVQKGGDIDGEATENFLGRSVSMPDANTVAIGAYGNDGNGTDAGHVRVYEWNGTAWQQKGGDINGEAAGDESGWSVSMPDTNTVAIGAPLNDGNGTDAGHVRVYSFGTVGVTENQFGSKLQVYPNPTNGELTINLGETYLLTEIWVVNTLGQEVLHKKVTNTQQFTLNIPGAGGIYTIKLNSGDKIAILKILKQD